MNLPRCSTLVFLVLSWIALSSVAWSQSLGSEVRKTAPRASTEIKIFKLVHSQAEASSELLSDLFPQEDIRIAVDERTNSVIVSADSAERLEAIEAVLLRLDESAGSIDSKGVQETRTYPFKHVKSSDLINRLKRVRSGNISFEVADNMLTVHGSGKALEEVAAIVRELDQPPAPLRSMRVRIIWLLASQADERLNSLSTPPDDLKPVLEELASLGIKSPKLATQMVLYGVAGGQELALNGKLGDPLPSEINVTGQLLETASNTASLKLTIGVSTEPGWGRAEGDSPPANNQSRTFAPRSPWGQRDARPLGTLSTQITAPPGHFVVLGATPMESLTSVFVLQVTPADVPTGEKQDEPEKASPLKATPKR